MPVTIATKRGVPTTRMRRFLLVVWAITVLLIGAYASFCARSAFPEAFDVSVASF